MKLISASIENIRSFQERIDFSFLSGLNVMIGPNGGGKTTLLQTIWIIYHRFLYKHWSFRASNNMVAAYIEDLYSRDISQDLIPFDKSKRTFVSLSFTIEHSDFRNLRRMQLLAPKAQRALDQLDLRRLSNLSQADILDAKADPHIQLEWVNWDLTQDFLNSRKYKVFFAYLEYFDLFQKYTLQTYGSRSKFASPLLFYASTRHSNISGVINADTLNAVSVTDQQKNVASNMYQNANFANYSTNYFGYIWRMTRDKAANTIGTNTEIEFSLNPDVKMIRKYLGAFGYDWDFVPLRDFAGNHSMLFRKNTATIPADHLSSGERELIHFILTVCTFNIRDGLIIIDEPEIHLHPKWQHTLLDLYFEVMNERNVQIIAATHSPMLIRQDTLRSVTRVYQFNGTSQSASLHGARLPRDRHLLAIVQSHNNERIFFADMIVLVEGIKDRVIFDKIFGVLNNRPGLSFVVEVIDVHGKGNFEHYGVLLDAVRMPYACIADLDYALDLEGVPGSVFSVDFRRIDERVLKAKRSLDRDALAHRLNEGIESGDLAELKALWEYIKQRVARVRDDLSDNELILFEEFVRKQQDRGIHLLRRGEIEDYLPARDMSLDSVIEMIEVEGWMVSQMDRCKAGELMEICRIILEKTPTGNRRGML